ncbi:hypothetical protein GWK16_10480 [Roseomonas sp. JC162]|uniref:Uncharacterized protein n=1 Tax=Neoroseomonas marina TaxID=1232220 RepID=A0A848EEA8_9PROT|nr:hypothetical protein [Neoroseomonas marina]NMJ41668.1 hypothetical protein [Neoroseomonas marina]
MAILVIAWAADILICRYYWKRHRAGIGFSDFCRGIAGTWHLRLFADLRRTFGLRVHLTDDQIVAIEREVRRSEFADVNFWRFMSAWCWLVILVLVFIRLLGPSS